MAELRDPNKLKKPKRPDLASTLALNLPYRTNIADVAGGYFETSDDEDSRHHARLGEMIKKEPFEESESNVSVLKFSLSKEFFELYYLEKLDSEKFHCFLSLSVRNVHN